MLNRKTNKIFLCFIGIALYVYSNITIAGTAAIYDDPGLATHQSGDNIEGYYYSSEGNSSCEFLFISNRKLISSKTKSTLLLPAKIFFFSNGNNFLYSGRDKKFDTDGTLYLDGNSLALKSSKPLGGSCMFSGDPGTRFGSMIFSLRKTFPALGIGIIKRKTFFYEEPGKHRRTGYLVQDDRIILIKKSSNFSYIKYVNPELDVKDHFQITTGWIRSEDIANPFPADPLKELKR